MDLTGTITYDKNHGNENILNVHHVASNVILNKAITNRRSEIITNNCKTIQ